MTKKMRFFWMAAGISGGVLVAARLGYLGAGAQELALALTASPIINDLGF